LVALLGCSSETSTPIAGKGGTPSAEAGAAAGGQGGVVPTAGAGGTPGPGPGGYAALGGTSAGGSAAAGAASSGAPSAGTTAGAGAAGLGGGGTNAGGEGGGAGSGVVGCSSRNGATTLYEKYADCFPIGAAVDSTSYSTHASVLKPHFNSITAENEMKFDSLQPSEGNFTYAAADKLVDFARSNDMRVRGHALVWFRQTPDWVFANASKTTLFARMKSHITNVVQHFKGKVYAWDVVNEAMMNDGKYRTGNEADDQKSQWYAIAGKDYIAEAFKYAHEADPDAKLFYNDYYDYIPAKQRGIYDMLKELLDAGVPIHGVGMQCHLNIRPSTDPANQGYYQDVAHLEDAIKLYSSLGLEVQVTELDLSLYVPGVTYTSDQFYTAATFTNELKLEQAARYREFFGLFRKYSDVISGVTLWGIADDNTWLSELSSGRKDFPLLFDDDHNPKKAYDAVMDF
jgi:endo-1,4-beta-xylanase